MVRADDAVAFPVVGGIPVLLWPEALVPPGDEQLVVLASPHYAEAYGEMGYYDNVADTNLMDVRATAMFRTLSTLVQLEEPHSFPHPLERWLDAAYDCTAQERVYRHIADRVAGATVLQMGGSGFQALKLLIAGAEVAILVTPMQSEARYSERLADELGFRPQFRVAVGVGEELPLEGGSVDLVLCGGTLHHMVTGDAADEVRRVLKVGGRFGACDPRRTPIYRLGTSLLGKRERGVNCRPLDTERISAFLERFGAEADAECHGALSRYPLIALTKVRISLQVRSTLPIFRFDDRLARGHPLLERFQSSVSICAQRAS
jgi:SAM-dependent methyltransferase